MALLFMDGFDRYGAVDSSLTLNRWDFTDGTAESSGGRYGTGRLRLPAFTRTAVKWISLSNPTLIVGASMEISSNFRSDVDFIILFDSTATTQIKLRSTGTGEIKLVRGSGSGTTLATSVLQMPLDEWFHIEVKAFIDNAAGTVEVRVNGDTWIDFVGDTQNNATANVDDFRIGSPSQSGTTSWDDLVLMDDTGSAPLNDFIGDVRIDTLIPTGDSAQIDFTPVGSGTTNSDRVDDGTAGPDFDTTYVESITVGHKDRYTVSDLTTPDIGTIFAVQNSMCAAKGTAGWASVKNVLLSGATEVSSADFLLSTTYLYVDDIFETDPDTASPWTESAINAIEVGQEVV